MKLEKLETTITWLHILPFSLSCCLDFAGCGKDRGLDSRCVEHAKANSSTDSETKRYLAKQQLLVECITMKTTPRASYIKPSLRPPIDNSYLSKIFSCIQISFLQDLQIHFIDTLDVIYYIHLPSQSLKMYISNAAALASALFSTIAFAAPSAEWKPLTATVQLANDQSGANANVVIPVDGVKRPVQELWGNTAVAKHGLVFASSAQLTTFQQTTACTITEEKHHLDATLNAEETWVSLGRPVVDLCSAYIVCECERMEGM